MDKYKNKYRIASTRLQHWDYRWAGAYFITICTQNREHYFGEIINGNMQLSQVGVIADVLWHQIPHHSQNVELGAFVVMPNHIHGIIIINDNPDTNNVDRNNVDRDNVETGHALSLPSTGPSTEPSTEQTPNESTIQPRTNGQQRFQNIGKNSISTIVGSYKSAVTKHANRLKLDLQWQTRFHDHIIRNDRSYQKITAYIINNPANWQGDKFYSTEQ